VNNPERGKKRGARSALGTRREGISSAKGANSFEEERGDGKGAAKKRGNPED